jgi:hypothetical protein
MFLAFAKSWTGTLEELVETVEDTVNNPVTVKETQAQ